MSQYKIGRNFAVADENADLSGMEDSDIKLLEDFTQRLIDRYGHAHYTVTDWAEESSDINDRCDISKLMDHCVTIEIDGEEV